MIFETKRLTVRKLVLNDLKNFHQMESNPLVLQYATGQPKELEANKKEIKTLISKYHRKNNDFWVYAIERKLDNQFIGTVALVKDNNDDEIGYRLLEKYWKKGYGFEVCQGLIGYAKKIELPFLIGYVVDKNVASAKILEKLGFKIIKKQFCEEINLPETKYKLMLKQK